MFAYCGLNFFSLAFEANCKNREHLGFYIHPSNSFHIAQTWELWLSYRPLFQKTNHMNKWGGGEDLPQQQLLFIEIHTTQHKSVIKEQ